MYPIKLTLFATFFLLATTAHAQISFGLKAGAGVANIVTDDAYFKPKMIPAFQLGGVLDFAITNNLSLQSGISIQSKGYKVKLAPFWKITIYPVYLQIPGQLVYSNDVFFVGAGPYVAFGIAGKSRYNNRAAIDSSDLEFGSDESDDFETRDIGMDTQIGLKYGSTRVGFSFQWEISNNLPRDIRPVSDPIRVKKHRVASIFVAYQFGKRSAAKSIKKEQN